jgi:hypothetical protein
MSILIAQLNLELNHIQSNKQYNIDQRQTLVAAELVKWWGQWMTDRQRCAMYTQNKGLDGPTGLPNITRWSGYTRQSRTEITRSASQHSHAFNAWLTITFILFLIKSYLGANFWVLLLSYLHVQWHDITCKCG